MKLLLLLLIFLVSVPRCLVAQDQMPFFHPGDVIVFQGDSITDGGRWRAGNDFNHIMGQDYAYILAAKAGAEFPEKNLEFINRGISGDRVVDLAVRWQTDTIALKPNVISILVGVNDTLFARGETLDEYESTYDQLLAQTLAALPHVKIILGEPFLLPVGKHIIPYSAELAEVRKRQAIVKKLAEKYHLPVVLYQDTFDAACKRAPADHWSWDGVHPTYAGHWLMMQAWLQAAGAAWPTD